LSDPNVTVIIPTIATRKKMLAEAVASVTAQTVPVELIVEEDVDREGPSTVRNRAVARAATEWIAFLDDDDLLHPNHIETLLTIQEEHNSDLVCPWFKVVGGTDPFPMHRGRQFDLLNPHIFPITVLLRKSAFDAVGGFLSSRGQHNGHETGEDFNLWLRLAEAGFKMYHIPDITWTWRHHGRNTSGLPSRW
jgi:glycosyltransferase involved in cell wall biosynthesis